MAAGAAKAAWAAEAAWAVEAANGLTKHYGVWIPELYAFEAGLWLYWLCDQMIFCLARPVLRTHHQRLHAEGAPAVWWPDQPTRYFFLHGVQVEAWMACDVPTTWRPEQVLRIQRVDQRREVLRRYGVERLLGCAVTVERATRHIGDNIQCDYTLVEVPLGEGRTGRYLSFPDATLLRQQGQRIMLCEGVPNTCQTVEQALHWRNDGAQPQEVA